MLRRRFILANTVWLGASKELAAQTLKYPSKPIKIVVGYVPGGTNDIVARLIGSELTPRLNQSVIIENKPGASAILGAQTVAQAKPDGYTLLFGGTGPMAFNPALYEKLPYSPINDFEPISLLGDFPLVVIGNTSGPDNLVSVLDLARSNPEKYNYGSASTAFRLPTEMILSDAKATVTPIGYKGSSEVLNAIMSNQISLAVIDPGPVEPIYKAGKLRVLATTAETRMVEFPNAPTLKELGINVSVTLWSALFAPKNTPKDVIQLLNSQIQQILKMDSVKERMKLLAMSAKGSSPGELMELVKFDIKRWSQIAEAKNLIIKSNT